MEQQKPKIRKLKYPLWLSIFFLVFTLLVPIILLLVQGLNSPSPVFRFSFLVIAILLIIWTFIRKFLLKNIEEKFNKEKLALEHDYSIEVGKPKKIKWLWYTNELWLLFINIIQVLLIGGLLLLLASGIANDLIKIRGISAIIAISYLIAYSIKALYIFIQRGNDPDYIKEENTNKENNERGE